MKRQHDNTAIQQHTKKQHIKKLTFLFFLIVFGGNVWAQKDVTHLRYAVNVKADGWGILGSIETEEPEHEEPNLDKPDSGTIFKTQIDKLGKAATETYGEQIRDYYVGDSLVRLDRNTNKMSEDEFVLIAPSAKKMTTYYVSYDDKPTYSETQLVSGFTDSTLVFEVDTFLRDKKNILGYDCYKIEIVQGRKNADNELITEKKYEMYVTDELSLSANVVIGMWQLPLEVCALEIKESRPDSPTTFIHTQATEIKKKQKNDLIELPKKYKNAKKKSYF